MIRVGVFDVLGLWFGLFIVGIGFVILRRYITVQVLLSTMLVLGFLVVILLGGRLIRYFGMAAEGGLQLGFLLRLIAYNVPAFLELVVPVAFFIALMLAFGRLYADSEMAVLNASGISRTQLGLMLMPLLILLMIMEAFLSLYAKPWGIRSLDSIWREQSFAQIVDLVRPKAFISRGDYHLYVGEIGQQREYLSDVIIIQTSADIASNGGKGKDVLIFANRATQVATTDSSIQLDLHAGRRYEFTPASRTYNQIAFDRYRISLDISQPSTKQHRVESYATPALLDKDDSEAMAELGYRLSMPWLMVLALMWALPLSQVNPRQGRWLKLVPAIFLFVLMSLAVISLKNAIAKQKVGLWVYPALLVCLITLPVCLDYYRHWTYQRRLRIS